MRIEMTRPFPVRQIIWYAVPVGKKAPEIQKTRWVTLLPKERSDEIGPQLVDGSML